MASSRFDEAITRIDAANAEDPRSELVDGVSVSRELIFARRVHEWVRLLAPDASEELLLAARSHTIRRWMIPRDAYSKTTIGYHQWRDALAQFHAVHAESILRDVGYPPDKIERVKALIIRKNWPKDEWGESKTTRILQRTWRKMSADGRARAMGLKLGEREKNLVQRAARSGQGGAQAE
jgi:hypothetical protein